MLVKNQVMEISQSHNDSRKMLIQVREISFLCFVLIVPKFVYMGWKIEGTLKLSICLTRYIQVATVPSIKWVSFTLKETVFNYFERACYYYVDLQ